MRRLFLLAFLCLQVVMMTADVVKGRVVDSDSREPLEGAQVQVIAWEGNRGYFHDLTTDSCGILTFSTGNYMCRVNLTVKYFGYEELKLKEFVAMGGRDTLDLGDLKMKMSEAMLREIAVKGKAKQFYMKGDTVVFNPEAFHLEDGARVSELMKKLPGVRIQDGKITFNGKEVHLKMNGHDMADDFLTAQLPAEAVQNIKAYERKSEQAELTGMNDGQEQQILDIVIKPGFLDKWYGQTKTSAYASRNYRASANMHYLSEHDPLGIYGRVSDSGSRTGGVWNDREWDYDNATPQRQQYGRLSYQHNWKVKDAETSYNEDHWSINTSPSHLDTHQHSWSNSETFLSGDNLPMEGAGGSSFSNSHDYSYNHSWEVPLGFSTTIHFSPKTLLLLNASGSYSKGRDNSTSEQETYHGQTYAEDPQSLVNSSRNERTSLTERGYMNTNMYLVHAWKKADFYAQLDMNYNHNQGDTDNHTEYDYRELGTQETLDQSTQSRNGHFNVTFDTKYSFQIIPEKLKAGVAFWFYGLHGTSDSEMLADGVYDLANSYERRTSTAFSEPRYEMEADLGRLWLLGRIKVGNSNETLDYHRGQLDTLIHHNTWFPRPHFEFKWKTTKTTELKGTADWEHQTADLLESSAYVDNTNPLYVTMGNPHLRGTSDLRTDLSYNLMFVRGMQMLSWRLSYYRTYDPVATARLYNAQTGAYASTTTNVDDRREYRGSVSYDRTLGTYFRLRSDVGYSWTQEHGVKTQTQTQSQTMDWFEGPLEQYIQNTATTHGNLRISFENNGWEVAASGSCDYDGITYSDPTLSGHNLWEYRAGMDGKYKLPHWTFELEGSLVGNAGYLSDMMNRRRFALNASATWKMLKGKGQLTLSAKDILNQMDRVSNHITPTMRSESRTETFHRYLALTFTYNLDARAKKK